MSIINISEKIKKLEERGVFIKLDYEHYKDGTNTLFSIEFRDHKHQTCWYGDNHEFGDCLRCIESAIKIAEFFLKDEGRIKWIMGSVHDRFTNPEWNEFRKLEREFLSSLMIY